MSNTEPDTRAISPDDNTNPFTFKMDLKDKLGNPLFLNAIKGFEDEDKIALSPETSQQIKEEVDRAAAQFCWGSVCSDIANYNRGSKDLLVDYKDLTITNIQAHANTTWNCTTDNNKLTPSTLSPPLSSEQKQRRIRSTMMVSWIWASLKKTDQKLLDLKKRLFQYKHSVKKTIEEDGPLMLKLIYDRINPSTRVGVRNLISKLFKFDLKDYNHDVPKMANNFKATYNLILEREDETIKLEAPFFDALLASINKDFTGANQKLNLIRIKLCCSKPDSPYSDMSN